MLRCIIAGYRVLAELVVYDSETGKELFSASMSRDVDDLYWDAGTNPIYISGGGRNGSGTGFVSNRRKRGGQKAELLVYKINE